MACYYGLEFTEGMLPEGLKSKAREFDIRKGRDYLNRRAISLCGVTPKEKAILNVANELCGLTLKNRKKVRPVTLKSGDVMVVITADGLPPLTEDRLYTLQEMHRVDVTFTAYHIRNSIN